jgi:hypothetical protein
MAIVNFFGTNWDSEAGLGTKIGYVASALNRGVLPSQIKNWIASVDPANAVQEVYDLLGIPESDPQPAYQEPVYQEPAYVEPEPWWVTQQREEEQRIAREQNESRQARVNEILGIQGLSAEQKGRFYLDQLARGYSDASLRQEVESILGYQSAWPQLQEIARNLQQQDQAAEAARQEAARQEAARVEAAKREAARIEAERAEAARIEADRIETERLEAERQEAARIAAEREAAIQEAIRLEAEKAEAVRQESIRQETIRQEMLRQEAIRLEAERVEAAKQETARQEAARQQALAAEQAEQQRVQNLTNERQNLFREIYGREGSPDEIQAVLDMPVDQVRSTLQKAYTDWLKTQQPAVSPASQLQQAIQDAAYTVIGEQGNDIAYNDITINGKTYAVINPTTIVRKADDQSGMTGKMTRYEYLDPDTGQPILDVQVDGGAFQAIMPLLVTIGTAAFPGLAQVIGTALGATGATATAIGGAVINAATSVAAGADPATAIKNAAISAGVGQLTSGLTGNSLVDSVVRSGATAALTGGDVGNAIINSVIANGAQQTLSGTSLTGDTALDSGLVSAATSVAQALATGGDVTQSAIQGFIGGSTAAINKGETPAQVAGTQTTIGGGATTDTTTAGATTGGIGTTPDVGMDTTGGATQDDVLGIVAQEQAANQAQSTNQAMQGAQQITAAEAIARELYALTERYQGPNGTIYLRDINTGKITQLLPTGEASTIAGGGVFLDAPNVIGAVEALPANAVYQGILYAGDPNLIGKQLTANDLASLSISTERDPNVLPVGNLVVTQNADGTVTQRDKVTGDTATIDASGNIVSQTKSVYTRANEVAGGLTGTAQAGLGELGAALAATAQQLGVDSQDVIDTFSRIQTSGELMRPETVNQQSQAFVDEIYRVASDPNATTEQIARAIASATLNNPAGAAAILGSELIQELPALLLPGGKVAQFLGSMALNAAESAGAQALQKIDELKVTNPNATPEELARMARQDAGVAGAVTAAIGLIPGANNVVARTLLEPVTEALEEGLIEYITTGDVNAAKGKAVLGAVIGGKTAAAINTGEELATAVQNNFGVQVPGGVAAPPGASLTVTGTRLPNDATGTVVDPGVDLTPGNLGTLPTTGVDIPSFDVASGATNTGVVVAVDSNTNQASVIDSTGALTIVPANGLTLGQTTILPTVATVTTGTGATVDTSGGVTQAVDEVSAIAAQTGLPKFVVANRLNAGETSAQIIANPNPVVSTTPSVTTGGATTGAVDTSGGGAVDTGGTVLSGQEGVSLDTGPVVSSTPTVTTGGETTGQVVDTTGGATTNVTTGVVLQDNGNGTSLVLTQNGDATNVPSVDATTGTALTPGASVTVDTTNNTATSTSTATDTSTAVTSGADTSTQADTQTQTGAQTATDVATQGQPEVAAQPAVTPTVTADVIQAPSVAQPTSPATNATTGVVLQDNGDGTSLVLTQDGGATNVPSVDTTGTVLTPGTNVTVDTASNTATSITTAADTATQTATQTATDTATQVQPETVTQTQTQPETQTQTQTQTQPEPVTQTQPETVTQVTPQPEVTTQPEVTPEPTPQINTEEPEPTQPEDLISPPPDLTPEDQLLQQIIKELEKPTVPETPPPPPIEPPFAPPESIVETPPVTVEQTLTVKPRTVPPVPPGSRVEESAQILPIRPGLSEGYLGDIEGTPEEEQQPVWNVRSLKLRRLLGI